MRSLFKNSLKTFSSQNLLNYTIKRENRDIILSPKEAKHKTTLIWLHGLGDSANGYLDLFLGRESPSNKEMKVILMTAPESPVTINSGMIMNSWYDINFQNNISEKEVEVNSKRIHEYYKKEIESIESKNIFIGGFSQGSCMSLYFTLNYDVYIGGTICLSGYAFQFINKTNNKNKKPKILTFHGNYDEVIPEANASQSYKILMQDNPNFHYSTYDIQHTICIEQLYEMKKFFNNCLETKI